MNYSRIAIPLMLLCLAISAQAIDVSGTVTVMKKGGKKALDDHSHAVVWLESLTADTPNDELPGEAAVSPAPKPAVVEQLDKAFVPRVLPVRTGQEIQFLNRDLVKHNVFSTAPEKSFDLGYCPHGEYRSETYDEPGRYRIYCNIHRGMICDIIVLDEPFFAATDSDGTFTIPNVTEGNYKLHVWHIFGGETAAEISVDAEITPLDLSVVSTVVLRQLKKHKNKFGKTYRSGDEGYEY